MPYSGADDGKIPGYVPKAKRARWVAIWNEVYHACQKEGGKTATCEARAFRAANKVIGNT